jgi:hypothetical protein
MGQLFLSFEFRICFGFRNLIDQTNNFLSIAIAKIGYVKISEQYSPRIPRSSHT